ncbi:MAG: flagellar filament capping protein FliD [Campylobacterales bacterium]|nr:flagellar filament capping protein FliD [Campylobacterales bacterium]
MAEITTSYEATYDYSMIGSFGSEATQSVNGDIINKIRAAEEKATLMPIIEKIDNITLETEKLDEIKAKLTEFKEITSYFDIYNDENVFNQFLFDASGTSTVFDVADMNTLEEGSTSVTISQLAQRDVYQSSVIADPTTVVNAGNLTIQIGTGTEKVFDTTEMTYEDLAKTINAEDGLTASIEQVGDSSYRLIIKSTDSGTSNALTIGGAAGGTLRLLQAGNHTLTAQNLLAKIDGVDYDVSSNTITTQGSLKITAVQTGTSTVTVSKDTSAISAAFEEMVTQYNDLVEMLNKEIYDTESPIYDKSVLRNILSDVKNILFQSYGAASPEFGTEVDEDGDKILAHSNVTNNDKNIFIFGFSFDQYGNLSLDKDVLNSIINGENPNYDIEDMKNVFTGLYENKGAGVQLTEYLNGLTLYQGLLYNYDNKIIERGVSLEEDKKSELERLDVKYQTMADQFTTYGAIIAQMEASFGAVEMMIKQSTAQK